MLQQVLTALAIGAFASLIGWRKNHVVNMLFFFLLRVESDGGSGQKKQRDQRYTAPSATFDSQE